ncbi:MAG: DMT family transporter [Dokdonella sp.]|uniref:DMT family transporter n=1 Tax=Dokdonella sp. TaxID=2291710 RepID=UPI002B51988C|nr:DMT family transporter [Dokdonella sp.]HQW76728.1 DMT family transporter [Dokdonella sp.]HQX66485.1 DMT family transporter [Dokdonella sp.]HQY55946.1 DMT family transporter [Dokdonella sp.]HQZ62276.1 DMT family transporter [Dokdonella sp.]
MNLPLSSNLRGILFMLGAVATFSVMDVCLKLLTPHYPAVQVAALRGLTSLPLVLLWVALSGGFRQVVTRRWRLHLLRGVLAVAMLAAFAFALRELPLAEAYSLFFVAPLLVTALAVPLLGERVDAKRWAAIAIGLAGVLVVLRPDTGRMFNLGSLAVLFAALAYAISAITVRVLGRTESTQSMVFWMIVLLSVFATAAAWHDWVAVRIEHAPILLGLAVSGALGQYAITEAFKHSDASVVVPFDYTALIWGITFDALIWHTTPDRLMLVGASIIVGSGIYLIRRERRPA